MCASAFKAAGVGVGGLLCG